MLATSMRLQALLFDSTTNTLVFFHKVTVVAPSMRMFFRYRHICMLVFMHLPVCSLLAPCMHKLYSVLCGCEDLKQIEQLVSQYYPKS